MCASTKCVLHLNEPTHSATYLSHRGFRSCVRKVPATGNIACSLSCAWYWARTGGLAGTYYVAPESSFLATKRAWPRARLRRDSRGYNNCRYLLQLIEQIGVPRRLDVHLH